LKTTRSGQRCDASGIAITVSAATLKPQAVRNDALHVAQQLLSTTVPRVTSSLDAVLQRQVQRLLRDQLASIVAQGAEDGAVVVLDNATGEVLAYVGSSGAFSQAAQVDAAQAARQAGSTLKPLIYGLAIEQQRLTAASVLDDNAVSIPTAAGLYTPHNYDEQFIGDVSVRKALGSSLNIPAVRALALLKPDALHSQMRRMGFSTLHADPEHYGLSLALGSADVKLIELTNAYRSLANGGLHSAWRYTPLSAKTASSVAVPSVRVFSSSAAWVVGHILSDNAARAHTFGFDSVLATPFWTAVKTGTSKDMRDNWCIGYSQRYTVGVWVGQAAGQAMRNVSGVAGAAPIWADVMHTLHRNITSKPPAMPAGVVAQAIRYSSDLEPARTEYFVQGTQPTPPSSPAHSLNTGAGLAGAPNTVAVIQLESKQTAPRITQPVNGSLMAWDPDIPTGQQGVRLKHSGAEQGHYWTVNGQRLDSALLLWQRDGVKGKTVLTLHSADGTMLDTVRFELRGR
jgi:penicillin-binding protein 1C